MKKNLLILFGILSFLGAKAQCNELFFSEYLNGSYNNKALEIYNPSNSAVSLSNYRIVTWFNGNINADTTSKYVMTLSGTIGAHDTYNYFLDRRNPNAHNVAPNYDTILSPALLATANNIVNQNKGKFVNPVGYSGPGAYTTNFNGDDAISLQKLVNSQWTNVDIFGSIGERPTNSQGTFSPHGAWTDTPPFNNGQGFYLSYHKTLIRHANIQGGVTINPAAGTFDVLAYWDSLPNNSVSNLGLHSCVCNPAGINDIKKSSHVSVYPNPIRNSNLKLSFVYSNLFTWFSFFGRGPPSIVWFSKLIIRLA